MLTILMLSTLIGVSCSYWLSVWVCLEINTLAMCFMISKDASEEKKTQEASMNYYLIQVMSSVAILISMVPEQTLMTEMVLVMALLMKMGAWPSHMWYLKLISTMNMGTPSFLTIMTWQKILPIFLVMSINLSSVAFNTLLLLALASSLSPLSKLQKGLTFKSIMALSSLNNNGWMLLACMSAVSTFCMMLLMYSASLFLTISFFMKLNKKSEKMKSSPWTSLVTISNMGGLPPMTMFWVKVIVLQKAMESLVPTEIMAAMVAMACVMLYHYLWSTLTEITKTPVKQQNMVKNETNNTTMMSAFLMSALSSVMVLMLGLTRKGSILMG